MNISEVRAKFPQYNDLSDDQLAKAIHGKYYADMPYAEFASKVGLGAQMPQEAPGRGVGAEALRQGGLMVRNVAEGAMGLPAMVMDPINRLMGLKPLSEATASLATRAGLPTRDTPAERISGEAQKAMIPGAAFLKAAQAAPAALQSLPMIRGMVGAPVAEILAPLISGGASQSAREVGAPEWAATAAGIAAPMGVNAAQGAVKGAARGANELRRPMTRAGQQQIAADIIGKTTADKTTALRNLDDYLAQRNIGVPGSKPTAAAVAGDYGITGAQQVISRGDANPEFARRFAQNNAARLEDIARLNATDAALDTLKEKRDALTKPLRDAAFAKARNATGWDKLADTTRVRDVISNIKRKHGGEDTQRAVSWIEERINSFGGTGKADPEKLYDLHQDINKLISGKIGDERGPIKFATGQAIQVKHAIAEAIDRAAPGFKRYLEHYSRLSRPIERLEILRDKIGSNAERVTNAGTMVTDEGARYGLSQAKMRNVRNAIDSELKDKGLKLAPRQESILSRVQGDLNANEFALRGGKQPGSDTYQNMASANFVNRIFGDTLGDTPLGRGAAKTLGVGYKPFGAESRINEMLIEAYLDPEKMRKLLEMARTSRAAPTLAGMAERSTPWVTGGLLGVLP